MILKDLNRIEGFIEKIRKVSCERRAMSFELRLKAHNP